MQENKNFLFSKYFYDKDNEVHKQIYNNYSSNQKLYVQSNNKIIEYANNYSPINTLLTKKIGDKPDDLFIKNSENFYNKVKLKIEEFQRSENFSNVNFNKFLAALLEKNKIKYGFNSIIFAKLNMIILNALIKTFYEYFNKNNLNLASEILEIAFKLSEPNPNYAFQTSLDYGLKKCNILFLAVILSMQINNKEKAVEYLRILINMEENYKKKLENFEAEATQEKSEDFDKALILTNNFFMGERGNAINYLKDNNKSPNSPSENAEKNSNISKIDMINNIRFKYNFEFSKNFDLQILYHLIIKDLLGQKKEMEVLKYIKILLNLYKDHIRKENIVKQIFEEKQKIKNLEVSKHTPTVQNNLIDEREKTYITNLNVKNNYLQKSNLINITNKNLTTSNSRALNNNGTEENLFLNKDNSEYLLSNNLKNKLQNKNDQLKKLGNTKFINNKSKVYKQDLNLDVYNNDFVKLLNNEYIQNLDKEKGEASDSDYVDFTKKYNIKNSLINERESYKTCHNILVNYLILSYISIKFLLKFGQYKEAEEEYNKRKILISEFDSLDLLEVNVSSSFEEIFNNIDLFVSQSPLQKNELDLNQKNNVNSNIATIAYSSPKSQFKSRYERLLSLEKNKKQRINITSINTETDDNKMIGSDKKYKEMKSNIIKKSTNKVNDEVYEKQNKEAKKEQKIYNDIEYKIEDINSFKSDETLTSNKPKQLKIDKTKIAIKGNVINLEDYNKKIQVLKEKFQNINSSAYNKIGTINSNFNVNKNTKIFRSNLFSSNKHPQSSSKDAKQNNSLIDIKKFVMGTQPHDMNTSIHAENSSNISSAKYTNPKTSSLLKKSTVNQHNFSFAHKKESSSLNESSEYATEIIHTEPNNYNSLKNKTKFSFISSNLGNAVKAHDIGQTGYFPFLSENSASKQSSKEKKMNLSAKKNKTKKIIIDSNQPNQKNIKKIVLPPLPMTNKAKLQNNKILMHKIKASINQKEKEKELKDLRLKKAQEISEGDENASNQSFSTYSEINKIKVNKNLSRKNNDDISKNYDVNQLLLKQDDFEKSDKNINTSDSKLANDGKKLLLNKNNIKIGSAKENSTNKDVNNIESSKKLLSPNKKNKETPNKALNPLKDLYEHVENPDQELEDFYEKMNQEFNLVNFIKELISRNKKDYEASDFYLENHSFAVNSNNYTGVKKAKLIETRKNYFHFKNIDFIRNINNSVFKFKFNVLKIQRKKNINKNYLILELLIKGYVKENTYEYKNLINLDLSILEKTKETFENLLQCSLSDITNIWPIVNFLIHNYLVENNNLLDVFTQNYLRFCFQKNDALTSSLAENNILSELASEDLISQRNQYIYSQYYENLSFLFSLIKYNSIVINEYISNTSENNENLVNVIDLSKNKKVQKEALTDTKINIKQVTDSDEILLGTDKIIENKKSPAKDKKQFFQSKNNKIVDITFDDGGANNKNDLVEKKREQAYITYLQSQNLFKSIIKYFEFQNFKYSNIRHNSLEQHVSSLFNKKIIQSKYENILFEEFTNIGNYLNAAYLDSLDEFNLSKSRVIPYKYIKKTIYDSKVTSLIQGQKLKIKEVAEKYFNTKNYFKIKSKKFYDAINYNLKNNYFSTNDKNKGQFLKQYLNISKKVIFNRQSTEQLLYDNFELYKGLHRIFNHFHFIEISCRKFDRLINDIIDSKISYLVIKENKKLNKNKNSNAGNNDSFGSNYNKKDGSKDIPKENFMDNIIFDFLPLQFINNAKLFKIDEKYKLKIFSKFTKITAFNSFVLVKIKGLNLYSSWIENILLPWEIIINLFTAKNLFERFKNDSILHLQEQGNNSIGSFKSPYKGLEFSFKYLILNKDIQLHFFEFLTIFIINLLTNNFDNNELIINQADKKNANPKANYKKQTEIGSEEERTEDKIISFNSIYNDSIDFKNIKKIENEKIIYYILKKINVNQTKRFTQHLYNFEYLKIFNYQKYLTFKKIFMDNSKHAIEKLYQANKNHENSNDIKNNSKENNQNNSNDKNNKINNNENYSIHYKNYNFSEINLIQSEFLFRNNNKLTARIKRYLNFKINRHLNFLTFENQTTPYYPSPRNVLNLNQEKRIDFLQEMFLESDKITEVPVSLDQEKLNQHSVGSQLKIKKKRKFFYSNSIQLNKSKYIVSIRLSQIETSKTKALFSNIKSQRIMLISVRSVLKGKSEKLKITDSNTINSILEAFQNLENKDIEINRNHYFNNFLSKYLLIDKNKKLNYSKVSLQFSNPQAKSSQENILEKLYFPDEEFERNLIEINNNPQYLNDFADSYALLSSLSSNLFYDQMIAFFLNKSKLKHTNFIIYLKEANDYEKYLVNNEYTYHINSKHLSNRSLKNNLRFLNAKVKLNNNETFSQLLNLGNISKTNDNNNTNNALSQQKQLFIMNIKIFQINYFYCDSEPKKYKEKLTLENNKISYQKYLEEKSKLFFAKSEGEKNLNNNINSNKNEILLNPNLNFNQSNVDNKQTVDDDRNSKIMESNAFISLKNKIGKSINNNLYSFYQNEKYSKCDCNELKIFQKTEGIQKNLIFKIENFINVITLYNRTDAREFTFIFDLFKLSEFIKMLTKDKFNNSNNHMSNVNNNFFYFNLAEFNKINHINYCESLIKFCKENLLKYLIFTENFNIQKSLNIEFIKVRQFYDEARKALKQEKQKDISQPTNKAFMNNNGYNQENKDPKSRWLDTKILISINHKRNTFLSELYEISLNEIKRVTLKKRHLKIVNSGGFKLNAFSGACGSCFKGNTAQQKSFADKNYEKKNNLNDNNHGKNTAFDKNLLYFNKNKNQKTSKRCDDCAFTIYVNYHKLIEYWNIIIVNPFNNRRFSANVHFSDLLSIPREKFLKAKSKNNKDNRQQTIYSNEESNKLENFNDDEVSTITPVEIWDLLIDNSYININIEGNCYVNFFNLKMLLKEVIYQNYEVVEAVSPANPLTMVNKIIYLEIFMRTNGKHYSLDFIETRKNKYLNLEKTDFIINAYSFDENFWYKDVYNLKEFNYLINKKYCEKSKNNYSLYYEKMIFDKIEKNVLKPNKNKNEEIVNLYVNPSSDIAGNKDFTNVKVKCKKDKAIAQGQQAQAIKLKENELEKRTQKDKKKTLEIKNIFDDTKADVNKDYKLENVENAPEIIYVQLKNIDHIIYNLINLIKKSKKISSEFTNAGNITNNNVLGYNSSDINNMLGNKKSSNTNKNEEFIYLEDNLNNDNINNNKLNESLSSFLTKINMGILRRERIEKMKFDNRISFKKKYYEVISNKPLIMINLDINRDKDTADIGIYYPEISLNEKIRIPLKEIKEKVHPFVDLLYEKNYYATGKRIIDFYKDFILDSPKLYLFLKNQVEN